MYLVSSPVELNDYAEYAAMEYIGRLQFVQFARFNAKDIIKI